MFGGAIKKRRISSASSALIIGTALCPRPNPSCDPRLCSQIDVSLHRVKPVIFLFVSLIHFLRVIIRQMVWIWSIFRKCHLSTFFFSKKCHLIKIPTSDTGLCRILRCKGQSWGTWQWGAPAVLLSLVTQGVFRGFRDTKSPLFANSKQGIISLVCVLL